MEEWVWWMIAAGVLAVGEIFTLSFFLGPIAVAAVAAAIVSLVGAGMGIQWIVFIAVSLASLAVLRPIARRHLRTPGQIRTGTAALVGSRAVVLDRVDGDGGQVKIGGEVWSARSFDEDHVFEEGARVEVLQIKGATALVSD
ncbi:MAG TPA: NfeD family protein [Thermoleophilaceae bacterium]|jgi:membrane protein implicated in regulation of membrane protease activity|nr:NfeD family protein [Thermoleophilaceae bacterium]